jgi:hypothetical protein
MFSLAERTLNIIERQQLAEERHYRMGGGGGGVIGLFQHGEAHME